MLKLFAGLALACLVTPVLAQECHSPADLKSKLLSHGDTIAGDVKTGGGTEDEIVIDVDTQAVWLWTFKAGCLFGQPIPFDDVDPAATPAPAAPAKPKLQGSGLEIGT